MSNQIVFLEGLRRFSASEKVRYGKTILTVATEARKNLGTKNPVVFTLFKYGKIVNGYTAAPDWIRITIPERKFNIKELDATIYHELNHVARGYSETQNIANGINLLEAVVAEGLGTYYEMSKVKGIPYPHGEYNLTDLSKHFKSFKNNLKNKNYNHFEWFFGEGNKPNMFGYRMGKYIVDEALSNTELSVERLTGLPASKILKLSRIVLS
ncbi:MAG: hypothetical protein NVSMB66_5790 [Candidatus Doudnabacteria bacterium]